MTSLHARSIKSYPLQCTEACSLISRAMCLGRAQSLLVGMPSSPPPLAKSERADERISICQIDRTLALNVDHDHSMTWQARYSWRSCHSDTLQTGDLRHVSNSATNVSPSFSVKSHLTSRWLDVIHRRTATRRGRSVGQSALRRPRSR